MDTVNGPGLLPDGAPRSFEDLRGLSVRQARRVIRDGDYDGHTTTALITPPIGINLYVVHGIRKAGRLNDVMAGTLPFVLTMFVMIGLLLMFPDLALWLPSLFY